MTRRNKTILTYLILILLAAALIASNRLMNSKKAPSPEKSYAAKLAELKADLMQTAKAGPKQQPASSNTKRTSSRNSRKAGST
jgi:hypothetical protein